MLHLCLSKGNIYLTLDFFVYTIRENEVKSIFKNSSLTIQYQLPIKKKTIGNTANYDIDRNLTKNFDQNR